MLLLKCPKCKQNMNYQNQNMILTSKRKKCVYCGFSMQISSNIVKKL